MTDQPSTATLRPAVTPRPATSVEIVVPVHDEERDLEASIRTLHRYLTDHFTVTWCITSPP